MATTTIEIKTNLSNADIKMLLSTKDKLNAKSSLIKLIDRVFGGTESGKVTITVDTAETPVVFNQGSNPPA